MKIGINSFGTLVRPRTVTYARIYPSIILNKKTATKEQVEDQYNLKSLVDSGYTYHYSNNTNELLQGREVESYEKPLEELFEGLQMGDTTKDLSNCYVGVITSLVVSIAYKNYVLITKDNLNEVLEKIKNNRSPLQQSYPFNENHYLSIHFVGLKFYKGVSNQEDGTLVPINPWETTNSVHTWFYRTWDLTPMDNVIRFENLDPGDLVMFRRTHGLVINKRHINKLRFYKTNSWSCKSVSVLMSNGRSISKFLPNKNFEGKKPKKSNKQ